MSGYQAPTAELIAEALRRTPTPVLRRAFYGKLRNPLWVRPLMEAGAFTAPPEPQITDDGLIRDIYCPEVDYLARVAGEVPDDVVDVLVPLKDSNNAWVKRATAEIAAVIPAAQALNSCLCSRRGRRQVLASAGERMKARLSLSRSNCLMADRSGLDGSLPIFSLCPAGHGRMSRSSASPN